MTVRGTTSACAENTRPLPRRRPEDRNYLRVRGEYLDGRPAYRPARELPPRARRIHMLVVVWLLLRGTTSACAENTTRHYPSAPWPRNYLRVRGEYFNCHGLRFC